jgi:hypothetical protein
MPTPAAVHMESLVAVLVPGGRGPSPVPIAKSSDGSPHAPPAEGRYTARPSPGGQQRRCAGRWLASRHAIIRGCHGRCADGRRARGRAIGSRAATHSDPPPLTLCSTLRARLHPLGEAARRRAGDRHLGRSEEKPPPRSCSKRGIQPSTAPERADARGHLDRPRSDVHGLAQPSWRYVTHERSPLGAAEASLNPGTTSYPRNSRRGYG